MSPPLYCTINCTIFCPICQWLFCFLLNQATCGRRVRAHKLAGPHSTRTRLSSGWRTLVHSAALTIRTGSRAAARKSSHIHPSHRPQVFTHPHTRRRPQHDSRFCAGFQNFGAVCINSPTKLQKMTF